MSQSSLIEAIERDWTDRPEWIGVPAAPGPVRRLVVADSIKRLRLTCFVEGGHRGSSRSALDRLGFFGVPGSIGCRDGVRTGWMGRSRVEMEISDPGGPESLGGQRYPGSMPLSKHALDVALSRGRHAVERAKLAGSRLFVGIAWRWEMGGVTEFDPQPIHDPYRQLASLADRELVALVGAAISAGQTGLPMICYGQGGVAALSVVRRLHPNASRWLSSGMTWIGMDQVVPMPPSGGPLGVRGSQSGIEDLQATLVGG